MYADVVQIYVYRLLFKINESIVDSNEELDNIKKLGNGKSSVYKPLLSNTYIYKKTIVTCFLNHFELHETEI